MSVIVAKGRMEPLMALPTIQVSVPKLYVGSVHDHLLSGLHKASLSGQSFNYIMQIVFLILGGDQPQIWIVIRRYISSVPVHCKSLR